MATTGGRLGWHRLAAVVAVVAVVAALLAVEPRLASAAGLTNTTYESDCSAFLLPGAISPFIVSLSADVQPDPSFPTGDALSAVGTSSIILSGPAVAGLRAAGVYTDTDLTADYDVTATDAGGSYNYVATMATQPLTGRTLTPVVIISGSDVIGGAFIPADVGANVSHPLIPLGSVIDTVTPGASATLVDPTTGAPATATGNDAAATIGTGTPMTFTDAAFDTGTVFTTAGANGGRSTLEVSAINGFVLGTNFAPLLFGSLDPFGGVCVQTGYDGRVLDPVDLTLGGTTALGNFAAGDVGLLVVDPVGSAVPTGTTITAVTPGVDATLSTAATATSTTRLELTDSTAPGPGHAPLTEPVLPAGSVTPLTGVGPPPTFASFGGADLVDPAPVPQSQIISVAPSSTTTITLVASSSDPTPTTDFQLTTLPAVGTLTVNGGAAATFTNYLPNNGTSLDVVYTAPAAAGQPTFDFWATDGVTAFGAGGTGTISLFADQLQLSCVAPGDPGYPAPTCGAISFPSITLDGTVQMVSSPMEPIFVSDARGNALLGWTLSSYLLPQTLTGGGNFYGLVNTSGADTSLAVNRIPAANLSIGAIACTALTAPPSAAVPGPGGAYAPGPYPAGIQDLCTADPATSDGNFRADGTYTLSVPPEVAAGTYSGTIQYLVV